MGKEAVHAIPQATLLAAAALFGLLTSASAPANALLLVDATVFPLGPGSFRWEISIDNQGPDDVVLVSLLGAPLADPAIDPSLETPVGFLSSYDGGLGIVDFLEDTLLFAANSTVAGFAFVTSAAPDSGALASFESLTLLGAFESGEVAITVVPELQTSSLVGLALAGLGLVGLRRSKEGSR